MTNTERPSRRTMRSFLTISGVASALSLLLCVQLVKASSQSSARQGVLSSSSQYSTKELRGWLRCYEFRKELNASQVPKLNNNETEVTGRNETRSPLKKQLVYEEQIKADFQKISLSGLPRLSTSSQYRCDWEFPLKESHRGVVIITHAGLSRNSDSSTNCAHIDRIVVTSEQLSRRKVICSELSKTSFFRSRGSVIRLQLWSNGRELAGRIRGFFFSHLPQTLIKIQYPREQYKRNVEKLESCVHRSRRSHRIQHLSQDKQFLVKYYKSRDLENLLRKVGDLDAKRQKKRAGIDCHRHPLLKLFSSSPVGASLWVHRREASATTELLTSSVPKGTDRTTAQQNGRENSSSTQIPATSPNLHDQV